MIIGEKVTLVVDSRPKWGHIAEFGVGVGLLSISVDGRGTMRGSRRTRPIEAEGVAWIRGHHAADSAEVQAMLAAYALVQK